MIGTAGACRARKSAAGA